jgi:hypothetical protein
MLTAEKSHNSLNSLVNDCYLLLVVNLAVSVGIQKFLRERHREVFAKTCLDWSQETDCTHERRPTAHTDTSHASPAPLPKKGVFR